MVEYIDITNEKGEPLGYSLPRNEVHSLGLWHRVVHVWIVDSDGMVLIQKRTESKDSHPSTWDKSCAGHIEAGMDSKETAVKELSEELGLLHSPNDFEFLFSAPNIAMLKDGQFIDKEVGDVYLITFTHPFDLSKLILQVEEVADAKLVHYTELYKMMKSPVQYNFVPVYDSSQYSEFEKSPYYKLIEILSQRYPQPHQQPQQ
ncbi:hypothetical protein CYY_005485 [Polysphondylium violaceum]|uniref:Nudix hydrolase domain-containing protein n=1 Tax=Polysphondylium violaceum TaxID=133409 RepID=A0A8J4PRS0_9MYCE|nr:hypothetical protein CYY_005485 [Polysphondylium violaceum]